MEKTEARKQAVILHCPCATRFPFLAIPVRFLINLRPHQKQIRLCYPCQRIQHVVMDGNRESQIFFLDENIDQFSRDFLVIGLVQKVRQVHPALLEYWYQSRSEE